MSDLITKGYRVLGEVIADYRRKRDTQTFDRDRDIPGCRDAEASRLKDTVSALQGIFPTDREAYSLIHVQPSPLMEVGVDVEVNSIENRLRARVRELESLADNALNRYTDLPIRDRLYVEDIDSFRKVRDVNPHMVNDLLGPGGYFDISENAVQLALEQILDVRLHQQDWGGEANDLYTANLILNGERRATAFMLKGNEA